MAPKTILGLPASLALYIGGVTAAATPVAVLAVAKIVMHPPTLGTALAVGLFFALTLIAELGPVPMDADGNSQVSISNVFIITVAILFGWKYAVPLAGLAIGIAISLARRDVMRILFNVSMFALAGLLAAVPVLVLGPAGDGHPLRLTVYILVGGTINLIGNAMIVSPAIALTEETSFREALVPGLRHSGAAFAIMSFLSALAANLWVLDAWLLVLLAGPLFTLTLYQRTALHSRIAARDARTDNLTGLGNHRAYQAALRAKIAESGRTGQPFSLCLVDLDNFKHINDTYGHPVGDDVLVRVSELLAAVDQGDAFRFGGDEFAVLVSHDELSAYREMERVQQRLARMDQISPEGPLTISAGIATYPSHAAEADALQRTADGALYWSKAHGKNRSCLYSPSVVRILTPREIELEAERNARLRAAKNLVRFVDARDPSTAMHSEIVSGLTEAIGLELGLEPGMVDDLRLGGLLHDIGKIGLPDAILRAPRSLTKEEYEIVKKHPEFGHSLLDGMGIDPVDDWVLHHHEHWDGSGYPSGLAGEEIPLGSRIILVADAFEAITADRPYRRAQSREAAIAELKAKAGTQFDPDAVDALERHLAKVHAPETVEAFA